MKEIFIIIWTVLFFIIGFLFLWLAKYKKRTLGKYIAIHKLILLLMSFGTGYLLFYGLGDSPHLTWSVRLLVLSLGILHVWAIYYEGWTKRDQLLYSNDGFLPEFLFTLLQSLVAAITITATPQLLGLINAKVDVSWPLWDLPLLFLLPFLVVKLADFSTQIPYRIVENPWIFPAELVNAQDWPWRNLMQVNFQLKNSLVEEYHIFKWPVRPWIEAPKEITLGKIFCLAMQERRQRQNLVTIQDLGNEYFGTPKFAWLFSIKLIWWRPSTWFRKPRYLNPDQSLLANKVQEGDIIIARRIPGDGKKPIRDDYMGGSQYDSEKTTIIQR